MKKGFFTIQAGRPFLKDLATGLIKNFSVSKTLVILPTRRSVQPLCDHLASQTGALLLPEIKTLAEGTSAEGTSAVDTSAVDTSAVDTSAVDTSAVDTSAEGTSAVDTTTLEQEAFLASTLAPEVGLARGFSLAHSLARCLNELEMCGVEAKTLKNLKHTDAMLARHWEKTPKILYHHLKLWQKDQNLSLVKKQTRRFKSWLEQAKKHPVVVAGSTGSQPHVARFLRSLATCGTVVLPGLDKTLSQKAWDSISPTHPQYALKTLLQDRSRRSVKTWIPNSRGPRRKILLQRACLPFQVSAKPRTYTDKKLHLIECPGLREESQTIALILRETLEKPQKTAALITHDRILARRVAIALGTWNIQIDDSAGIPLSLTLPGVFLRLVLHAARSQHTEQALLNLLKHPFAHLGQERAKILESARLVEMRQKNFQKTWKFLKKAVLEPLSPLKKLLQHQSVPFSSLLEAHQQCASALSQNPQKEIFLWSGEAGRAAKALFCVLQKHALPPIAPQNYENLLERLMGRQKIWLFGQRHPRLFLWSPLEARLQSVDVAILGGLNEGVWPPKIPFDPWLNRALRKTLGLHAAERFIGLSAHDFVQHACAPTVILTRSTKAQGNPTTAARWLKRIKPFLKNPPCGPWPQWQQTWQQERQQEFQHKHAPQEPPPCPPPALRPKKLSVSDVADFIQNPYRVYAQRILRLKPVLETKPTPQQRGLIIHKILEEFAKNFPKDLPKNASKILQDLGKKFFAPVPLAFRNLWVPRFEESARWLLEWEERNNAKLLHIHAEVSGHVLVPLEDGQTVKIRGRADRIDIFKCGAWRIYDYKTGAVFSKKKFSPQLLLLAMMALAGNFEGLPKAQSTTLAYIFLKGKTNTIVALDEKEAHKKIVFWHKELKTVLRAYLTQPYPYTPPSYTLDPFGHLARYSPRYSR